MLQATGITEWTWFFFATADAKKYPTCVDLRTTETDTNKWDTSPFIKYAWMDIITAAEEIIKITN